MYTLAKHFKYPFVLITTIPMSDIEKIDFALCNQPTETPDHYYKRQSRKPDIITNGGFFNMSNGVTCFGLRDEEVIINISEYPGVGITGNKDLSFVYDSANLRDFISAYPTLVERGMKLPPPSYVSDLDYNARRTCIGWNKDYYFIVTVDLPGLKFSALSDIFIELGAEFAINLDGGGSTRLLINGERKTSTVYARPVDNVMCVYLNSTAPKKPLLYRVQLGAFSKSANASALLAELRSRGFNDAYVRLIGKYYKVQVGAFSVKLNADRLRDKLQMAGYSSFITTSE